MIPADLRDRLEVLRNDFEKIKKEASYMSTDKAIEHAKQFDSKTRNKFDSIKKQFGEYAETIAFCEEVAYFYLECGYKHFARDRNATVTIDPMYSCASAVLANIEASKSMSTQVENAYRDWHWHGW